MRRPTLLLTRPERSSTRFAAGLSDEVKTRTDVVIAPLMSIEPVNPAPVLDALRVAIFTSAQGVALAPKGAGRHAFCVGAETARVAGARGWRAECAGRTAEDLIAALTTHPPAGPLVHLAGAHHRGNIAERLTSAGIPTDRVILYRQNLLHLNDEARRALDGPSVVPLFSPRSAAQFAREARKPLPECHLVAMSYSVKRELSGLEPAELVVLGAPTAEKMRETVENLCLSITSA